MALGLHFVPQKVEDNWRNNSEVLVSLRYGHVLGYRKVIFQISQFKLIIGWGYQFLMILPPKNNKIELRYLENYLTVS